MKIQEFINKELGSVRTLYKKNECFFNAADVAEILLYNKASNMTKSLEKDEVVSLKVETGGGVQKMTFLSESGLYHAIFKSRKKEAKKFRKWVTNEVLPAIRESGGYFEEEENLSKEDRESLNRLKKICIDWIENHQDVSEKELISDRIGNTIYDVTLESFAVKPDVPKVKIVDKEGRILMVHTA